MRPLFWVAFAILGIGLALLVFAGGSGQTLGMANNQFAHLVKLGALALLAGAFLFRRRIALSEHARNVALWLAFAFVLVAGYQYRYEFQDVLLRISAGLVPGSPISSFDAQGRESVHVERGPGGHFEAQVEIDGTPIRAVIDTGASATVLTADDAGRIGLSPDTLSYVVPVSTANGQTQAARATVREIAVGAIRRTDMSVLVARPGVLEQSLLGMNFIGSLSGFDMRGSRLILRD